MVDMVVDLWDGRKMSMVGTGCLVDAGRVAWGGGGGGGGGGQGCQIESDVPAQSGNPSWLTQSIKDRTL